MAIYIVDVFITGFLSMFVIKEFDENGIETYHSKRRKVICLGLILLLWVMLFTFRGTTGGDPVVYRIGYKHIYNDGLTLSQCFEEYRDKLYILIVYVCTNLSGGSWVFGCFVIGTLIYTPMIILISKKSEDVNLSCLLYLFMINAFFAFNGVRQALAGSFALCAYYFGLREKKIVRYVILLLLAFGFHASVLLLIPFQLLSLKKLKRVSTYLLLIVLVGLSVFFNQAWSGFADLFSSNDIVAKYSTEVQYAHGSSIIRVLVWLVPIAIGIYLYPRLSEKYSDVDHDILMLFFGTVFMVYSMFDVSFSQMSHYFVDVNLILFPKMLVTLEEKNRKVFKYLVVIFFFAYMILLILNGDMQLNPYVPVWKSGMY